MLLLSLSFFAVGVLSAGREALAERAKYLKCVDDAESMGKACKSTKDCKCEGEVCYDFGFMKACASCYAMAEADECAKFEGCYWEPEKEIEEDKDWDEDMCVTQKACFALNGRGQRCSDEGTCTCDEFCYDMPFVGEACFLCGDLGVDEDCDMNIKNGCSWDAKNEVCETEKECLKRVGISQACDDGCECNSFCYDMPFVGEACFHCADLGVDEDCMANADKGCMWDADDETCDQAFCVGEIKSMNNRCGENNNKEDCDKEGKSIFSKDGVCEWVVPGKEKKEPAQPNKTSGTIGGVVTDMDRRLNELETENNSGRRRMQCLHESKKFERPQKFVVSESTVMTGYGVEEAFCTLATGNTQCELSGEEAEWKVLVNGETTCQAYCTRLSIADSCR